MSDSLWLSSQFNGPRGAALKRLTEAFVEAGLPTPALDARLLACEAADITATALVGDPDAPLGAEGAARLAAFAQRRLAREPVSRILGRRGFWTLTLDLRPGVLDPRPDSETLIEAALDHFFARSGEALRVLDLGVGSGALLCAALDALPAATGVGVDLSPEACATARDNLARCALGERGLVVEGDWSAAPPGPFDLILANPPYIETVAIDGLEPEARDYDPRLALDGGPDGLDAYRALAPVVAARLAAGGLAAIEAGQGQARAIEALLRQAGLSIAPGRRDLNGVERAVLARR